MFWEAAWTSDRLPVALPVVNHGMQSSFTALPLFCAPCILRAWQMPDIPLWLFKQANKPTESILISMHCKMSVLRSIFSLCTIGSTYVPILFQKQVAQHWSMWAKLLFSHKMHSMTTTFKIQEFLSHSNTTPAKLCVSTALFNMLKYCFQNC